MEWLKSNKIYYIDFKYIIEITEITADNREKMHNANRRDGKKEKEEREWEKEINRVCMQSKRLHKFHILFNIC